MLGLGGFLRLVVYLHVIFAVKVLLKQIIYRFITNKVFLNRRMALDLTLLLVGLILS